MNNRILHCVGTFGKYAEILDKLFQDWSGWEGAAEYYGYENPRINGHAKEAAEAYNAMKHEVLAGIALADAIIADMQEARGNALVRELFTPAMAEVNNGD